MLTSALKYLAMQASLMKVLPASFRRAALYVNSRAASICVATWAIWCCIPWNIRSTKGSIRMYEPSLITTRCCKKSESKYRSWPGSQRYVFQTAPSVWCKEQCDQSNPAPVQASETHTKLEHHSAEFDILTEQILCFNLPVQLFQSYPRSTSRWHTYSHDRPLLKCSSLAPRTENREVKKKKSI